MLSGCTSTSVPSGLPAGTRPILRPEAVADLVLEALAEERFLILPHPQVAIYEQRRAGDRERWINGMRRVQAQVIEPRR